MRTRSARPARRVARAHQAPEVDGNVVLVAGVPGVEPAIGELVGAKVVGTDGVDLIAVVTG